MTAINQRIHVEKKTERPTVCNAWYAHGPKYPLYQQFGLLPKAQSLAYAVTSLSTPRSAGKKSPRLTARRACLLAPYIFTTSYKSFPASNSFRHAPMKLWTSSRNVTNVFPLLPGSTVREESDILRQKLVPLGLSTFQQIGTKETSQFQRIAESEHTECVLDASI